MRKALVALATAAVLLVSASSADATAAAGFSSTAQGISDTGWIVGEVQVPNSSRCTADQFGNVCVRAAIFATETGRTGVRKLGTLGGPSSRFTAVNSRGQIVGGAETATKDPSIGGFVFKAVISDRGGPLVSLGTLGGNNSQAQDIDERGTVVGQGQTSAGEFHAFVKYPGQPPQDLGTLGGIFSSAEGISRNGRYVAGFSETASGATRGFVWDGLTKRTLPPLPGGAFSRGNSVNGSGDVVGTSSDAQGNVHAVIWQHGSVRKLVDYGAGFARALSIADSGAIVGWTGLKNGTYRAFKTDAWGTTKQILPALGSEATGFAINNQRDAVGDSLTGQLDANGFPRYVAVLYTGNRVINLTT